MESAPLKPGAGNALLLELHPCAEGLGENALLEIAAVAELVRGEPGDVICSAGESVASVYFIIHGRLCLELLDPHGGVIVRRYQGAGEQVGGIAAATAEPQPLRCTVEEAATLLRFDSHVALELSRKHERFRENWARLTAQSVTQTLLRDKTPPPSRIAAFFHCGDDTRALSRAVLHRLVQLGESPHVFADRPLGVLGVEERQLPHDSRQIDPVTMRRQSAEWLRTGRLLFDLSMSTDRDAAVRAVEACDHVFWCVTPQNWRQAIDALRALEHSENQWREKVGIAWLLAPGELAPTAAELRSLVSFDVKICFGEPNDGQGPAMFFGVERVVHRLRGLRIGLALGGGAARGMAHVGVLKALEQSGIVVDAIAGTSAGAMTGTVYASGFSSSFMIEHFAADLRPPWWFRCLPRGEQWHLLYRYRRKHFDPMLRKYLGDAQFEQLYVPMHTVTVDLISGRDVVRSGGDAVHGILESINLPPLATPINRAGQALVDGGLINNVPANVLAARGCSFIIAVSVTAKMELEFADNRPDTPLERMRRASTLQTLLRAYLVQGHSVNAAGIQSADFIIEPDVRRFDLSAFTRTAELAAIGERETLAVVPKILALLNRLDSPLFPEHRGGLVENVEGRHHAIHGAHREYQPE